MSDTTMVAPIRKNEDRLRALLRSFDDHPAKIALPASQFTTSYSSAFWGHMVVLFKRIYYSSIEYSSIKNIYNRVNA